MPRRSRRPTGDLQKQASAMVPMEIESAREKLLALAGFPLARRAEIVKRAIETQVDALDATKPTKEGEATDWDARLRAADALQGLFGAVASRATSGGSAPTTAVQIVVELPQYAREVAPVVQADQGFPSSEPSPAPEAPRSPLYAPQDHPDDC